ncbi:hypothetical protein EW026_g2389 [Hermanssonia centrifuga]|uniref:Uncharacterized protein n=1 Tax=Hermanssonia centrifuga TaxID=98765 RepID=A0A4S4KND8_9APHY|nr:hypothetical protein EW026_g2389 [Hermanssonia centrifuga]
MYVETAGGENPTFQCPQPHVIRLGGISATISSYESLALRGYIVDAILLFRDEYYRNWEYLHPYFADRGLKVVSLDAPPEKHLDPDTNFALTEKYYQQIVPASQEGGIFDALMHLDNCHANRLQELESMPRRTLDTIWWPFVQHGLVKSEKDVNVIDSASGDTFSVYNGKSKGDSTLLTSNSSSLLDSQFDGSASWWTQALGHAHPSLTLAAARAAGSYHGDTIGAMDACEEGVYTCEWHESKGYWLDPPTIGIRKGKVVITLPGAIAAEAGGDAESSPGTLSETYDVQTRLQTELAQVYRGFIERTLQNLQLDGKRSLAALVLEPIVMGAGGMIFVDPLFQRILVDVVRSSPVGGPQVSTSGPDWAGLPVIFDEVFVGLYRLAIKKADALLHGHSYTAYPVGCEVANETLELVEKLTTSEEWKESQSKWKVVEDQAAPVIWSLWDPRFVDTISRLPVVGEVMTLGTVLSIKIADDAEGYQSHSAQRILESIKEVANVDGVSPIAGGASYSINYRTLGSVAYFMLSLNTSPALVRSVEDRIWKTLAAASR